MFEVREEGERWASAVDTHTHTHLKTIALILRCGVPRLSQRLGGLRVRYFHAA